MMKLLQMMLFLRPMNWAQMKTSRLPKMPPREKQARMNGAKTSVS